MAKEKVITRTIIVYQHTFAMMEKAGDGIQVKDTFTDVFDHRLGMRQVQTYLAEVDRKGYSLVDVRPVEKKYALPLSEFLQVAKEI